MSMIEVRLLQLQLKGDRLDEINAEEVLERQAAARAWRQALLSSLRRSCQQFTGRFTRQPQADEVSGFVRRFIPW